MMTETPPADRSATPPPAEARPSAGALPTRRSAGALRAVLIAFVVVLLLVTAFFGGAVATTAWGLFDSLREPHSDTTVVRPQPGVVRAVRELARLETTTFHMERVIDLTEEQRRFWGLYEAKDSILLVAAADVTAGVDLSKMEDDDVRAEPGSRSVRLTLPQPEVLTTTLDNERTYVHTRDTELLATRRVDLESRARQEAEASLRDAALDSGILEAARKEAEHALGALLRSLGYDAVEIRWR